MLSKDIWNNCEGCFCEFQLQAAHCSPPLLVVSVGHVVPPVFLDNWQFAWWNDSLLLAGLFGIPFNDKDPAGIALPEFGNYYYS